MKYRPEIDGLRTVAVLPVVLYHAGVPFLSGGFAGVDVFFVISGFLITRIIAEEARERRFSILRFYERRARRILPALFLVMLVSIPLAWRVMVPYQLENFTQSMVATLVFLSNVLFWFEAGYFAVEADFKPLLHTWSLAVEEQFYVVFPLLLVLLYRLGAKTVVPVLAVFAAGSFAAALFWGMSAPSATFFLIQFRAWELLIGALAALWMMRAPPAANDALAATGLAAVLLSFFIVSESSLWPGPLTLLPVLGSAAVILFSSPDSRVGRALAWGPMRGCGLISYSLYLWHLPLLVFLNIAWFGEPPALLVAGAVAASFLGAFLSWRFVERPFRVPGVVRIGPFLAIIVATAAPLFVFGYAGARSAGFQATITASIPPEFASRVIDRQAALAARRPIWRPAMEDGTQPFPEGDAHRVLILGDSLSADLLVATAGHADMFPASVFRRQRLDDPCMNGLTAHLAGKEDAGLGETCAEELRTVTEGPLLAPADEIVLAANWQPETVGNGIELARSLRREGYAVSILGVAAFNDMASLSMQLHRITEPEGSFFYRNIRSKFLSVNAAFREVAEDEDGIRYLDKLALYCDETEASCDMLDGEGKPVIFDSAHVTAAGVDIMADRIKKAGWFE